MIEEKFDELVEDIKDKRYNFLVFDKCDSNRALTSELRQRYDTVVIIGFGASKLNISCLLSINSPYKKPVIYIDNLNKIDVDSKLRLIANLGTTIFLSISRSGNTQETYLLTKYILQKREISTENVFIICPRSHNILYNLSKNFSSNHIEYDPTTGGRFGVLSASTLLAIDIAGLDSEVIINYTNLLLESRLIDGDGIIDESSWFLDNYNSDRTNLVTFDYTSSMLGFFQWQSQLIAESLGKNGFGITPSIATGTFDEHSYLQLYLDGRDDKFFKLVIDKAEDDIFQEDKMDHFNAVSNALKNADRQLLTEIYNNCSKEVIISKVISSILIVMLIAKCVNIDPFTQPAVDYCKTRV